MTPWWPVLKAGLRPGLRYLSHGIVVCCCTTATAFLLLLGERRCGFCWQRLPKFAGMVRHVEDHVRVGP